MEMPNNGAQQPQQPQQNQQTPQPQAPQANLGSTQYAQGCLGAAWSDITKSPNWISKSLLICLINIVPILNFFTMGYSMSWGAQLKQGQIAPMPKQICTSRNFEFGFYAFVITVIGSFASGILATVLQLFPGIGALVDIAAMLFVSVVTSLMIIRIAATSRFSAAFEFKTIWNDFKSNLSNLLCATLIPELIFGGIVLVLEIIIFMIFARDLFVGIIQLSEIAQVASSGYVVLSVLQLIASFIPLIFAAYAVSMFCYGLCYILSFRALGHYIVRYGE